MSKTAKHWLQNAYKFYLQLFMDYNKTSSNEAVVKAIAGLQANGIDAVLVQTGEEAKKKVIELIPEGSEIMTMTSVTLDTLGISKEFNESGKYNPVRAKLYDKDT